ncbi:MAG: D-alanine--D-alanine ligase family protein [Acidimicrobiales bacterium]
MSATNADNIGVIFGGPSPEHDVSILTGLQAARALLQQGRSTVQAIYWTKGERFFLVSPALEAEAFLEGTPKGARELQLLTQPDGGFFFAKSGVFAGKQHALRLNAVVNCCHGGPGEDGTLQGALDMAGTAYTGPNAATAALCMDKLAFGALVQASGLPSLPRQLVSAGAEPPGWDGPYIVKPRFGGSSIGIEVIEQWADVVRYGELGGPHSARGLVVEPYHADAYDVQVAVRSYPALSLSLFERPIRSPGAGKILGYKDKYLGGEGMVSAPRELPAQLAPSLEKELRAAAQALAGLLGLRGVSRIDFLVNGSGAWWVNEVNTIPGSLAKYLWTGDAAVDMATLLSDMVAEARLRPSAKWSSVGADGSALRSAASIASKLS